jgi:hypothetical protein
MDILSCHILIVSEGVNTLVILLLSLVLHLYSFISICYKILAFIDFTIGHYRSRGATRVSWMDCVVVGYTKFRFWVYVTLISRVVNVMGGTSSIMRV